MAIPIRICLCTLKSQKSRMLLRSDAAIVMSGISRAVAVLVRMPLVPVPLAMWEAVVEEDGEMIMTMIMMMMIFMMHTFREITVVVGPEGVGEHLYSVRCFHSGCLVFSPSMGIIARRLVFLQPHHHQQQQQQHHQQIQQRQQYKRWILWKPRFTTLLDDGTEQCSASSCARVSGMCMLEKKMYSLYMAVPLDDHFTQSMNEERFMFFIFNIFISVIINIHHQCHHPSPIGHQDRNLPKKEKTQKNSSKYTTTIMMMMISTHHIPHLQDFRLAHDDHLLLLSLHLLLLATSPIQNPSLLKRLTHLFPTRKCPIGA